MASKFKQKLYNVEILDKFTDKIFNEEFQAPHYDALMYVLANEFGDDWKRRYFFLDCEVIDDDY